MRDLTPYLEPALPAILLVLGPTATIAPWTRGNSSDDLTLIMRALMTMDAKVDEIVDHVVAIRSLLEDDEEEEEEI